MENGLCFDTKTPYLKEGPPVTLGPPLSRDRATGHWTAGGDVTESKQKTGCADCCHVTAVIIRTQWK